jgi:hypothetical protein
LKHLKRLFKKWKGRRIKTGVTKNERDKSKEILGL